MMMLEDLRLALRQICRAMGLPGDAATVISLVVLGVALNIVALRTVTYVGIGRHTCHDRVALSSAARTELKVMRTVMTSTLKKIGNSGRRWCLARQKDGTGYHIQVGFNWAAPTDNGGCDVTTASGHSKKMAIAVVQC
jgi:hypothetical protein